MFKEKVQERNIRQITFYMESHIVDRVRQVAKENNTFISEIGRALVIMGLPTLEKQLKQERENRE